MKIALTQQTPRKSLGDSPEVSDHTLRIFNERKLLMTL